MAESEPAQKIRPNKIEADERLLIEAAQRDRALFADIYDKYFEMVYAYAGRRMRDRARTEDLTSEVFHKALANLPRFKWTGAPFGSWLLRIASNLIADRTKRAARERTASLDGETDRGSGRRVGKGVDAPSQTVGLLPRGASGPPQSQQGDLEDAERRAHLFSLVNGLAEDQRRVVVLRFAEEKSIREIANELGRSEGAVKQLQFRALENLRKKFTTEDTENMRTEVR